MLTLLGFFSFIKSNLKWVAVIVALLVFSVAGWKIYSLVNENATQRAQIVQLENDLKLKTLTIELIQKNFELSQEVVAARDKEISDLELQSREVMINLPEDENALAPESTRVFLDRLKGISK